MKNAAKNVQSLPCLQPVDMHGMSHILRSTGNMDADDIQI